MDRQRILTRVAEYYTATLQRHGCTPQGADWRTEESQLWRFAELLRLIAGEQDCSLIDYGCGYGMLADYLHEQRTPYRYIGFDLSVAMVAAARSRHQSGCECRFAADRQSVTPADFAIASGVLNVRLDIAEDRWGEHVLETIDDLASLGRRGFAFNALSSHVPTERRRAHLYYADPIALLIHCAGHFSPQVSLLHDRVAHEFTIIVRRVGE